MMDKKKMLNLGLIVKMRDSGKFTATKQSHCAVTCVTD